ncbi:MAG: hypothetical protein ACRDEA_04355, partial [Microcystaceae cyanobacterium]
CKLLATATLPRSPPISMSEDLATIQGKRHQTKFIDKRSSREYHWQFDGGVEVAASASPHIVPVPYKLLRSACKS